MPVTGEGAILELNEVGKLEIHVADQTSDSVILPMVRQQGVTNLAFEATINSRSFTVDSSSGILVGQHIRIINALADRYYWGLVLGVSGNIITVDNPLDHTFIIGSEVTFSDTNMAVDGSGTPVIFALRTGAPSIPSSIDITRIIITCTCLSTVDLS